MHIGLTLTKKADWWAAGVAPWWRVSLALQDLEFLSYFFYFKDSSMITQVLLSLSSLQTLLYIPLFFLLIKVLNFITRENKKVSWHNGRSLKP